jgi:hypothetical protein
MIAFLDHEDFSKARRALMISAMTLLILQNLTVSGDAVGILGLQVEYNQQLFVFILKLSTFYLLYVFTIFAVGIVALELKSRREKSFERRSAELLRDFKRREVQFSGGNALRGFVGYPEAEDVEERLKSELVASTRRYDRLVDVSNFTILLLIKVFVPFLVASAALIGLQLANFVGVVP